MCINREKLDLKDQMSKMYTSMTNSESSSKYKITTINTFIQQFLQIGIDENNNYIF